MISLADVDYWERPLRYHYCRVHELLRAFPIFLLPLKSDQISFFVHNGSFRDMILQSNGPK